MAGSIQLESRGLLDQYTTANPDFTFFKEHFRKKSQFSLQFIDIKPTKDFEYGETHRFTILRDHCDVLRSVSLRFTLPDIVLAQGVDADKDYVYGEACNFVEYIRLYAGDTVLQHITTEYLDLYAELEYPTTKQVSLFDLCKRDVDTVFNPAVVKSRLSRTRPYPRQLGGDVCIEIPFYFHGHPELAFPVCALAPETELYVEVKFRDVSECICVSRHGVDELEGFIGADANDLVTFKPFDLKLSTECVFLDPVEKIKVQNSAFEFPVTQIQYDDALVEEKNGTVKPEFKKRLHFTNLVQELYFFVMYTENNAFGSTFNYNALPVDEADQPVDPSLRNEHINYVTLTLDGEEILDEHTGSPHFLRIVQPRLHHRNTPITRRFCSYSFALYPNDNGTASGHVNFSVIKEPMLRCNLFTSKHEIHNTGTYAWHDRRFHILAKTMNFMRIKDGRVSQVFDYMI